LEIVETALPGVLILEPRVFEDDRGFFMETFHAETFRRHGLPEDFVQDNHSWSGRGVLRGLHYQSPNPQGKLVRVVAGAIWDVAVDIRRSSPHFGRWVGVELSAGNRRQLWIPEDFAHGFCVIGESAEVIYKCTAVYDAASDRTLRWDDPALGIDWPEKSPRLSAKDAEAPPLSRAVALPN
jgi:dTDP-4-dehydrorhamnose 3,5-epimerase